MLQFSPSDSLSKDASTESETRQGTETPASSLDFDLANINPRLIEPGPSTFIELLNYLLSTKISVSSARYLLTSADSNLAEICTPRVTRGAAKAVNLQPSPWLPSQHATRSSRKRGGPEEQPGGEQKGKGRSGKVKASIIKPTPRRLKRLRARCFMVLVLFWFWYSAASQNVSIDFYRLQVV
jgi:hypothetical protein